MPGLQKEIWVAGIKENPVPDNSFLLSSVDMSEYVDNNKLHLQEAGISPQVFEDFFGSGNEMDLPTTIINDTPSEVVLKTYSTSVTRHRNLQDVELSYDKRSSIINRHKVALETNLAESTIHRIGSSLNLAYNPNTFKLYSNAPIIDSLIDLEAHFASNGINTGLNIIMPAAYMAQLKKEDYKLYKDIIGDGGAYGFKIHRREHKSCIEGGMFRPFGSCKSSNDVTPCIAWHGMISIYLDALEMWRCIAHLIRQKLKQMNCRLHNEH